MKTRLLRLLLVLAVLCGVFPPTPTAHALPKYGWYTEYYDCLMNTNGVDYYSCYGSRQISGYLGGSYKYDESWPCDGIGEGTAGWYQWTGSGWEPIAGPPAPAGPPYPC